LKTEEKLRHKPENWDKRRFKGKTVYGAKKRSGFKMKRRSFQGEGDACPNVGFPGKKTTKRASREAFYTEGRGRCPRQRQAVGD